MNRSMIFVLCAVFLFVSTIAANSFAQDKKGGYILIKPGVYIPQGDLKDKDFDTGFSGELVVGNYYTPNLALEAGVGYFRTEASKSGEGFNEEDDIWVVPVTVSFKGVLPFKGFELNAGGGGGIYFANINAKGNTSSGSFDNDGHAVAFGGHVLAGANVDITPKVILGVEGKYILTTGERLLGTRVNLNGFMVTGVIGYRF